MSKSKLMVIQKKIIKFVKSFKVTSTTKTLYLVNFSDKDKFLNKLPAYHNDLTLSNVTKGQTLSGKQGKFTKTSFTMWNPKTDHLYQRFMTNLIRHFNLSSFKPTEASHAFKRRKKFKRPFVREKSGDNKSDNSNVGKSKKTMKRKHEDENIIGVIKEQNLDNAEKITKKSEQNQETTKEKDLMKLPTDEGRPKETTTENDFLHLPIDEGHLKRIQKEKEFLDLSKDEGQLTQTPKEKEILDLTKNEGNLKESAKENEHLKLPKDDEYPKEKTKENPLLKLPKDDEYPNEKTKENPLLKLSKDEERFKQEIEENVFLKSPKYEKRRKEETEEKVTLKPLKDEGNRTEIKKENMLLIKPPKDEKQPKEATKENVFQKSPKQEERFKEEIKEKILVKSPKSEERLTEETEKSEFLKLHEVKLNQESMGKKLSEENFKIIIENVKIPDDTPEKFIIEIPPRKKCRLSCPLPPPGFENQDLMKISTTEKSPNPEDISRQKIAEEISRQKIAEEIPRQKIAEEIPRLKSAEEISRQKDIEEKNIKITKYKLNATRHPSGEQKPAKSFMKHIKKKASKTFKSKNKKNYPSASDSYKSVFYKPPLLNTPKMKALMFTPNKLELFMNEINVPTEIRKDEVLIEVAFSGVCGTDLFILEGKLSVGENPIIPGQEVSGKIYAVGSDVHHVSVGDNVAVNPHTACGVCRYCTRGLFSSCLSEGVNSGIGVTKDGGWAEYIVVKKNQVHKLSENLSLEKGALLVQISRVICAMSKLKLSGEQNIFIQGLGLNGCLWASVFHAKGFKNVSVGDKDEKRQDQFSSIDLGYPILPLERLTQSTADVIIDCTGLSTYIERAFKMANPQGQICLFGKPSPSTMIQFVPYDIIKKEIVVFGNVGNSLCFSKAIDLASNMSQRYLDLKKLGVKMFNLEEYSEAFRLKRAGELNKILFKFEEER